MLVEIPYLSQALQKFVCLLFVSAPIVLAIGRITIAAIEGSKNLLVAAACGLWVWVFLTARKAMLFSQAFSNLGVHLAGGRLALRWDEVDRAEEFKTPFGVLAVRLYRRDGTTFFFFTERTEGDRWESACMSAFSSPRSDALTMPPATLAACARLVYHLSIAFWRCQSPGTHDPVGRKGDS